MTKQRIRVIAEFDVDEVLILGRTKTKAIQEIHKHVKEMVEKAYKMNCVGLSVQSADPKNPLPLE